MVLFDFMFAKFKNTELSFLLFHYHATRFSFKRKSLWKELNEPCVVRMITIKAGSMKTVILQVKLNHF